MYDLFYYGNYVKSVAKPHQSVQMQSNTIFYYKFTQDFQHECLIVERHSFFK